jgi:hypothetical protein
MNFLEGFIFKKAYRCLYKYFAIELDRTSSSKNVSYRI